MFDRTRGDYGREKPHSPVLVDVSIYIYTSKSRTDKLLICILDERLSVVHIVHCIVNSAPAYRRRYARMSGHISTCDDIQRSIRAEHIQ